MDQLHVLIMSKCLSGLNSIRYGRQGTRAFRCICLFIWISRWSQKHHLDSYTAVCFSLLSSSNHQFQPVIKYVANVAQAATDAQNNQYLRGHLFPGKAELSVLQTSLLPVPRAVPLDPYLPVLQSWAKLWAWFTIIGFRLFIKILRLSSMH